MEAFIEHYQRTIDMSANKLVELFSKTTGGSHATLPPPSSPSCATVAANAAKEKINESKKHAVSMCPSDFHFGNHFYPKVLRSKIGAVGKHFFALTNEQVVERYCKLNPTVDRAALAEYLAYKPKYFKWAGCDLFNVTNCDDKRQMIIIETNSCPSGECFLFH